MAVLTRVLLFLSLSTMTATASPRPRLTCAGVPTVAVAAKSLSVTQVQAVPTRGTVEAVVLFGGFRGGAPEPEVAPAWAQGLLDPQRAGSISHFFLDMSFGALRIHGQIAPGWYEADSRASAYAGSEPSVLGPFGRFSLEIIRRADADVDFSRFDNDGPDGIPDSGDDDGVVDAVFVVIPGPLPPNFLLGPATGIATLGLEQGYLTDDVGVHGQVWITNTQGTVQQARTFAEAAGTVCHEFGHLLGLPDLYDTGFLQSEEPLGPEEDSAGIGAWGLMGWGALGWNGDDGPNSLSAWSRVQLGWTESFEPDSGAQEQVRLAPVGSGGRVLSVPVAEDEHFLLEYRTRTATFYDRNIPAEGVLIWHIGRSRPTEPSDRRRVTVDLECADGRWRDAGFPQGQSPDAITGEDNLGYWAHDEAYARAHAGNLGDVTDPFDGQGYTSFTADTNPAAAADHGDGSVAVEDIRIVDGQATARVSVRPVQLSAVDVVLQDQDEDGLLFSGEDVEVVFSLANVGGLTAGDTRAVLRSNDPHVEVVSQDRGFGDIAVGKTILPGRASFPAFRFNDAFQGRRDTQLLLDLWAGGRRLDTRRVDVRGYSPRQVLTLVSVLDSLGNGDGHAQAGEFIRLGVELSFQPHERAVLDRYAFLLHSLSDRVRRVTGPLMIMETEGGRTFSRSAPEFLVSAVPAGTPLPFELEVRTPFSTWRDTIRLTTARGPDLTPPRVPTVLTRWTGDVLEASLSEDRVLEGGSIDKVGLLVYDPADSMLVATVALELQDGTFRGNWDAPGPGPWLVQGSALDGAGNLGVGRLQLAGSAQTISAPSAGTGAWRPVPAPGSVPVDVTSLTVAPGHPDVMYAAGAQGISRSIDGGVSWEATGYMASFRKPPTVWVDAQNPMTVYARDIRTHRSRDGGATWERFEPTNPDVSLLFLDPVQGERLFGYQWTTGQVWVSDDGGASWTPVGDEVSRLMVVNPADGDEIYSQVLTSGSSGGWWSQIQHSIDGGMTWQVSQPRPATSSRSWRLVVDPHRPGRLIATSLDTLLFSEDSGQNWRSGPILPSQGHSLTPVIHPTIPGLVAVWAPDRLWLSTDGGLTWASVLEEGRLQDLDFDPTEPRVFISISNPGGSRLLESRDFGRTWQNVSVGPAPSPAGAIAVDSRGRLLVGSAVLSQGRYEPAILVRDAPEGQWELVSAGQGGAHSSLSVIDALFVDPAVPSFLLANFRGTFLQSRDGGHRWQANPLRVGGYTPPVFAADPNRPGTYYGAGDVISLSDDAGSSWRTVFRARSVISETFGIVTAMGIVPSLTEPGIVYTALDNQVWRSRDFGQNWEPFSGVSRGTMILAMERHPLDPRRLFIASREAFYESVDEAETWTQIANMGEASLWLTKLRFHPRDGHRMYLASGSHLLETHDGGSTWTDIGAQMGGRPIFNDVVVDPAPPHRIYAATMRGLYELTSHDNSAVGEAPAQPRAFGLHPNYPNPFNSNTVIGFDHPSVGQVRITIHNLLGQRVRTLVDEARDPGHYTVRWDGRDDGGHAAATGVYLYQLRSAGRAQTRKLILLR